MKYAPVAHYGLLRKLEELPLHVYHTGVHGDVYVSAVRVGNNVRFSTALLDVSGVVLAIDHGAVYPLRIQYTSKTGDSHIQAFTPNEFLTFQLLETICHITSQHV